MSGQGDYEDYDAEDADDGDDDASMEDAAGDGGAASATATATTTAPAPPPTAGADSPATEKRKAIRAIMSDKTLTDLERRLRIQRLMDGSSRPPDGGGGGAAGGASGGGLLAGGIGSLLGQGGSGAAGRAASSSLFAAAGGLRGASSSLLASAAVGGIGGTGAAGGDANAVACVHYDRQCSVVAPCCGGVFGCRVCHDEVSTACGPMDRFAISEVVCRACGARQGSKTNSCGTCGVTFAEYHCPKCNIWMSLSKRPFHCDECGLCRVGGRANFRHCAKCCMCVSASVHASHSCMQDKYRDSCPVCREDMFTSRQPPQDLPCGHAIHAHCFRNLAQHDFRCPICKRTVVSRASMSAAWGTRRRDIQAQPMPPDLARDVDIICNDCGAKSGGLAWHFLGVECPRCESFNTQVEGFRPGPGRAGNGANGGGAAPSTGNEGSSMGT